MDLGYRSSPAAYRRIADGWPLFIGRCEGICERDNVQLDLYLIDDPMPGLRVWLCSSCKPQNARRATAVPGVFRCRFCKFTGRALEVDDHERADHAAQH